jgi:hypothetical protein
MFRNQREEVTTHVHVQFNVFLVSLFLSIRLLSGHSDY